MKLLQGLVWACMQALASTSQIKYRELHSVLSHAYPSIFASVLHNISFLFLIFCKY